MKPPRNIVLAAALAALTVAGCVAMEDRPQLVLTPSGVQRDTYIPREGTAPYHAIDPYGNNLRAGPASPD